MKNMLEISNFTCCFNDKPMVSMLKEIVIPAFVDTNLQRAYKDSLFFFIDVDVEDISIDSESYKIICGRFVKKHKLVSEQEYESGQLIKRVEAIDDAPSSVFALIVDNHRLLLANETAYAPTTNQFASTIRRFLNIKLREYVVAYSKEKLVTIQQAKTELGELFLNIVPQPSKKAINDFIDQYEVIQKIRIELIKRTNHERDSGIWEEELRKRVEPTNPRSAAVEIKKSDGIKIDAAKEFVQPIAERAQSRIILSGIANNGQRIVGDTHSLRLREPISLGSTIHESVMNMLRSFRSAVNGDLITLDQDD